LSNIKFFSLSKIDSLSKVFCKIKKEFDFVHYSDYLNKFLKTFLDKEYIL